MFSSKFLIMLFFAVCQPCKILINEVNIESVNENDEFVELTTSNCNEIQPSLRNYLLLVIREYDKLLHSPVIVFSADLYQQKFGINRKFYVIGAPSVTPDLSFKSNAVVYPKKYDQVNCKRRCQSSVDDIDVNDVLPNGNVYSNAIILLMDKSRNSDTLNKLKLSKYNPAMKRLVSVRSLAVSNELQAIIRTYLVDAIVFSRKAPSINVHFLKL